MVCDMINKVFLHMESMRCFHAHANCSSSKTQRYVMIESVMMIVIETVIIIENCLARSEATTNKMAIVAIFVILLILGIIGGLVLTSALGKLLLRLQCQSILEYLKP